MKSKLHFITTRLIFTALVLTIFDCNVSNSQNWNPLSTGTDGTVYATLIVPGIINDLYIAGNFITAGGVPVNRIAKWTGSTWVPLGSGMDRPVHALTYYHGHIIAGGEFTTPANRIAEWNGTSWTPLTLGTNDDIYSLAVYFNDLRAGGKFTTAGGVNANRIAVWDGTSWSSMSSGVNDEVYSMAIYGNDLIVGGRFTNAGGQNCYRIAKWNGVWSALGAGMDNGDVRALAVFGGNLYAGGTFTTVGGVTVNHVAKWNGTNWGFLTMSGTNDAVYALFPSSSVGVLAIGGLFTMAGGINANQVATWSGTNWGTLGTGMSGGTSPSVFCFSDYSAVLHAAGNFLSAGGQNANNVALWGSQPGTPVTISPSCGAQGQSSTPLLVWSTVSNASSYALQLADNPNFIPTIINLSGITQSQYQVPSGLLSNNTYYWKVNSSNALGTSQYSGICWFTVSLTGITINTNSPPEFKLYNNYPNPFNPSTVIKFALPERQTANSNIKLTIFDAAGRKVSDVLDLPYKAGVYEVKIDFSELEHSSGSGIYFYHLAAGDFQQTSKMIFLK